VRVKKIRGGLFHDPQGGASQRKNISFTERITLRQPADRDPQLGLMQRKARPAVAGPMAFSL